MSETIRNAGLAALITVVITIGSAAVAEQPAAEGTDAAPGMMQGTNQMHGMDGMMPMMGMMERMAAMMTLCEKMMGSTPSPAKTEPS